jgi:hypothetical protein
MVPALVTILSAIPAQPQQLRLALEQVRLDILLEGVKSHLYGMMSEYSKLLSTSGVAIYFS